MVALFRPGPLQSGAVDDYVDRNTAAPRLNIPPLRARAEVNLRCGAVSEQLCKLLKFWQASRLAKQTCCVEPGKKKPEEMAKVREQFLEGSSEEILKDLANQILIPFEKFAGYAFNKSHSATYALISVQTAWLKTFYPAHFLAANLSAEMQTPTEYSLLSQARGLEIKVLMPSINESDFHYC